MKPHQMHTTHAAAPSSSGRRDHDAMLRDMRAPWLWTNTAVVLLGLWLISSPFTFGYTSAAMTWSDVLSGAALAALGGSPSYAGWDRWVL